MATNEEVIEHLRKLAAKKTRPQRDEEKGEDFSPNDWAGGNIDDAYSHGEEDGAIGLAQEMIAMLDGDEEPLPTSIKVAADAEDEDSDDDTDDESEGA